MSSEITARFSSTQTTMLPETGYWKSSSMLGSTVLTLLGIYQNFKDLNQMLVAGKESEKQIRQQGLRKIAGTAHVSFIFGSSSKPSADQMAATAAKRVLFLPKKRSKRKLGRALLCLPFALQMGFCVSSRDTPLCFRW
jgi:hypothetical protein